jgi:hypothetical protein
MRKEIIRGFAPAFIRDHRIFSVPLGQKDEYGRMARKPLSDFGINHGLPLKTVGFFFAILGLVILFSTLPIIGSIVGTSSPPLFIFSHLVLPGLGAWWLSQADPDGRPVSQYLMARMKHVVMPKYKSAGQPIHSDKYISNCNFETVISFTNTETKDSHE